MLIFVFETSKLQHKGCFRQNNEVLSRTRKELASREHLRETIKLVNFYCVAFKNKPHSQPEAPDRWFTEQGGNFLKDISPGKQFR